jgi:hypothetical protein
VRVRTADVPVQRELELGGRAFATARLVPSIAFAPSRALLPVPSSEISSVSTRRCSSASKPWSISAISPFTNATRSDALAEVARAAVAQLDGFVLAGRCARRDRSASGRAAVELDLHLDGRVASGVEDLAADDVDDLAHGPSR